MNNRGKNIEGEDTGEFIGKAQGKRGKVERSRTLQGEVEIAGTVESGQEVKMLRPSKRTSERNNEGVQRRDFLNSM
ncbi:hypothetical protein TWF730_010917 [Orbilia blumenaviensis]|uniref:Uncharacterized protein n=1 Tax=Orbilia blumenaviensis TaxID=1796055 RepID=A0AAV9UJX9_9PEZI